MHFRGIQESGASHLSHFRPVSAIFFSFLEKCFSLINGIVSQACVKTADSHSSAAFLTCNLINKVTDGLFLCLYVIRLGLKTEEAAQLLIIVNIFSGLESSEVVYKRTVSYPLCTHFKPLTTFFAGRDTRVENLFSCK